MKIILGSQSEGRQDVLREMGYEFEVMPADIDEKAIRYDNPKELVLALANAKADALQERITEPALLITADQVVIWKDEIREKPENEEEARRFLETAHKAPAEPTNGIVVINTKTGKRASGLDSSKIYFREIPEETIEQLVHAEGTYKRAGGFAIKDPVAREYIEKVEGTFDSVTGLPKALTERLLKEAQME